MARLSGKDRLCGQNIVDECMCGAPLVYDQGDVKKTGACGHDIKGACGQSKEKGVFGQPIKGSGLSGQTAKEKGVFGQPIKEKGVFGQSIKEKGVFGQPINEKGVFGQPIKEKGVFGQPIKEKGVFGQPIKEKGVFGQPTKEKGVFGQPIKEKGVFGQPIEEKGVFGQPIKEKGVSGQTIKEKGVFGKDIKTMGLSSQNIKKSGPSGQPIKEKCGIWKIQRKFVSFPTHPKKCKTEFSNKNIQEKKRMIKALKEEIIMHNLNAMFGDMLQDTLGEEMGWKGLKEDDPDSYSSSESLPDLIWSPNQCEDPVTSAQVACSSETHLSLWFITLLEHFLKSVLKYLNNILKSLGQSLWVLSFTHQISSFKFFRDSNNHGLHHLLRRRPQ